MSLVSIAYFSFIFWGPDFHFLDPNFHHLRTPTLNLGRLFSNQLPRAVAFDVRPGNIWIMGKHG